MKLHPVYEYWLGSILYLQVHADAKYQWQQLGSHLRKLKPFKLFIHEHEVINTLDEERHRIPIGTTL